MPEEFPGNSHSDKRSELQKRQSPQDKRPEKKVERVVTGRVVRRKPPLSKRFKEHFFPTQDQSPGDYVLFNVLLPAAQNAISEAVSQGVDLILFGESRGRRRSSGGSRARYRDSYREGGAPPWVRGQEDPRDAVLHRRARATHSFDQFIIADRVEAEEVLDEMYNLLAEYDKVTVGDFYDALGESKEFTDENYGWTTLAGTRILRAGPDGYYIDFPPVEQLKRR